jgi:hypothetical protein
MSNKGRARRFLSNVAGRPLRSARLPGGQRLVYEGDIYLRPVGHRVLLLDVPFTPELDDWPDQDVGLLRADTPVRARITVEYLGPARSDDPEDR